MPDFKSYRIGPTKTPIVIKLLLILILSVSLLTAIATPFLKTNFLQYIFGISLTGVKNLFFWQFLTYSFLQPGYGLDISLIIVLIFNLYLIWMSSTAIVEKTSQIQYLIFYLLSTIFTAFIILLTMLLGYKNAIFSSSTVVLYATLIAWMMMMPKDTKIYLLFAIAMKHYYLVLGLICFNLLSNLSNMDLISFFAYLSVTIFAYFYSVIVWHRHSPFHFLEKMERSLIYMSKTLIDKFSRKNKS